MTFAPCETAAAVIAVPAAVVNGSSRMTLAPLARQPSACDFWRAELPCAFSTCAEMPAFLNAAVRYGASKSV